MLHSLHSLHMLGPHMTLVLLLWSRGLPRTTLGLPAHKTPGLLQRMTLVLPLWSWGPHTTLVLPLWSRGLHTTLGPPQHMTPGLPHTTLGRQTHHIHRRWAQMWMCRRMP